VNDLAQVAATSKVRQYADDTSAYSACATPIELSCSLSKDLDSISCWIKRNKLFLNTAKNQLMLLSRRKRSRDLESVQVELMGSKVDWRHTVKYLGVWIGEKLTWEDHIKYVGKSALVAWLDFGKCELFYLRIH
jgi:Cft2 family RNA processing exonuclease